MSTITPQEFVYKWRTAVYLKERSSAQEHFIDLCHLIGHDTPAQAAPTGHAFTFEAGANKLRGGRGWADVWKKGFFAWEYKGHHADLDKAYQQLLQYREALKNPPLLVVCDLETIVIHTNFTNTVKRVYTITLEDLRKPIGISRLRALFYEPHTLRAPQTTAEVTEAAAKEFALLAELLAKYGEEPQHVAHFLIRVLFCLFAEDIDLLPKGMVTRLITSTRKKPAILAQQMRELFAKMAGGGWFGADEILHFNGGLFDDDHAVIQIGTDAIAILRRAAALDWGNIEPSILGTLFERGLDPAQRSQLGAHYTGKEDILLVVEPVLMTPLRRRWAELQAQVTVLAAGLDEANGSQRTKVRTELTGLLRNFADELAQIRILDPACGSGNFLYVALKQLLDLQKEIFTFAGEIGAEQFFPSAHPRQLYGIEINTYANELARATVWIGYIQWLRDNGFGFPPEPILQPLNNIPQMDAILAYDAAGQPTTPEWPPADIVIGNPPFLGSPRMRSVLGDEYCNALLEAYKDRMQGLPDLICYWFEHTRGLIEAGKVKRAGLLATNSIRGGANRQVLSRISQTGNIFMAWSDRPWVMASAAVRISVVGFDNGEEQEIYLDGQPVSRINADLTVDVDLSAVRQLKENQGVSFQGVILRGPFNITFEQAQEMLSAIGNPHGRPNSDVIKPRCNGRDITQRSSNSYVIDFGADTPLEEAVLYEKPFEYVKENVYPMRQKAKQATARDKWWLHEATRAQMCGALKNITRYIATPTVAKHRLFVWLEHPTLPDHQLIVFARDDDYFFGVLHARPHELWALRTGTWLGKGNDPRYTPTTTFETYPFPWPPGQEPVGEPLVENIAEAARRLVELRENWLNPPGASAQELKKRTLTNLYNQRPAWLDLAHRRLDGAVLAAYGWPAEGLSNEEILSRLLALNRERR
jgi:hypothetical protein